MMYTTFDKTDKRLRITLTDEGRVELAEQRNEQRIIREWHQNPFYMPSRPDRQIRLDADIFYGLIDQQLCNGWEIIAPEDIGALTSNPYILADDATRDDHGTLIDCGAVYAFDPYQIRDPLEDLERLGYVDFTGYSE